MSTAFSQQKIDDLIISDSIPIVDQDIDPLAPSRAAFYSDILPGLGQAYNKKYWKIPIIYAALGVSTYAYIYNNDNYNRARDAFKLSQAGKPHEFDGSNGGVALSDETLERVQKSYKEDRDLSLLITVGIYALQIVEASVNAHLMQLNTIDDIAFRPTLYIDPFTNKSVAGVSVTFDF
ncbi:MAG: hypothetical protein KUG51_00805 [Urechidicola sp.]|nr:hypothetical protein [Urechidicola sp.]